MDFNKFSDALSQQFHRMSGHTLYKVDISKDAMWEVYLASFPEGTNPIYRERTVHDCQCCKHFIRRMGNVICYIDGVRHSIWDATPFMGDVDPAFVAVAYEMSTLLDDLPIREPFYHYEQQVGVYENHGQDADGEVETWNHFQVCLPASAVMDKDDIATKVGKLRSTKDVFKRSLEDIDDESIETVLDLVAQKSLYRGEEHVHALEAFRAHKLAYATITQQEAYLWEMSVKSPVSITRIRNTSIGTLLVDLSEGVKDLDASVKSFEDKVSGTNYKRPKALVTVGMIVKAKEKVEELGLTESLQRRHASPEDITINNVLFADRSARAAMGDVFDQLQGMVAEDPQKFSKVEEVSIETFIDDILPTAESIELMLENKHVGNLMSLIAPLHADAPNMLMWENNFSWTYNGEVADSIKERVKSAGGKVDGVIRFSIQWNDGEHNNCDYDAWCQEPQGMPKIYYGNRRNASTTGNLDVDITSTTKGRPAVENITWSEEAKMKTGKYIFSVHNFAARTGDAGFTAELEHDGEIRSYVYNKPLRQGNIIKVVTVDFKPFEKFEVIAELPSSVASREVWSVQTQQYRKVTMVMNSPNYWDGEETGNKHLFFILEGCTQPGSVRGFYNEFLMDNLRENRKVFEHLGSMMRVEESENQLSGLGFSLTQRNSVLCRVKGTFNRVIQINF
jgi:hypothetical protein